MFSGRREMRHMYAGPIKVTTKEDFSRFRQEFLDRSATTLDIAITTWFPIPSHGMTVLLTSVQQTIHAV